MKDEKRYATETPKIKPGHDRINDDDRKVVGIGDHGEREETFHPESHWQTLYTHIVVTVRYAEKRGAKIIGGPADPGKGYRAHSVRHIKSLSLHACGVAYYCRREW